MSQYLAPTGSSAYYNKPVKTLLELMNLIEKGVKEILLLSESLNIAN